MEKRELVQAISDFVAQSEANLVRPEDAIYPDLAGLRIYDADLLVGFAAADDPLFTDTFKCEGVISPQFKAPREWLPQANTVISFFLPFTEAVRASNRTALDEPTQAGHPQHCSAAWMHARVEGQDFLDQITDHIEALLRQQGYRTLCPTSSGQLGMITPVCSNWSELHVAFACGLGTFGLSKGLITAKGMAGRFGSVITDAVFEPTPRPYTDPFEYCTMCGACQRRCPVGAIDVRRGCALGKDQAICAPYLKASYLPPHGPRDVVRYGCGKCQVGVPCEKGIPGR